MTQPRARLVMIAAATAWALAAADLPAALPPGRSSQATGSGGSAASSPISGSAADVRRLQDYQRQLADRLDGAGGRPALAALLGTALALAAERSADGAAPDENRAALVVLMFHVNGWPIQAVAPDGGTWAALPRREYRLGGRHDLAQHFIVSAAIAATAGQPLAALAGVLKELTDARDGSGFSFSDLAADRAGMMLGIMATRDDGSARRLQAVSTRGLTEDAFMPSVAGLADNLPEATFAGRFGRIGDPAYQAVVADIDRRIGSLALFR
jgi:hypothetical protein